MGTVILKKAKNKPPETAGRDMRKYAGKAKKLFRLEQLFFGVAIQINCSIPYKSAKNIDFLLSLLYNYAVFLYLRK